MDVGKQLHTPAHNFTACNSCHTLEIDVFETKIEESEYIYKRIVRGGGCLVVVAQWQSTGCTSQVSWVRFPVTAGLFTFPYFRLKNI